MSRTETPTRRPRRRRILIWTLAPVLALIAAVAPLAYLSFLRGAELTPEEFLAAGGDTGTGPVVAVAGASTVHGIGSSDFVAMLRERMGGEGYQFVNAGINGSTSADLLERADELIAVKPDAVAVLVGTNDVMSAEDVDSGLDDYRENLTALARKLNRHTDARLAFYSLQPLGEDLDDDHNRRLARFNAVAAEVAADHDAGLLPLNERLSKVIEAENGSQPWDFGLGTAAAAGFQHYYLGRSWNEIGEANGFVVLIDGVHLNERGARIAADLTEEWLREGER